MGFLTGTFSLPPLRMSWVCYVCQVKNALKYPIFSSYFHAPTHTETTFTHTHNVRELTQISMTLHYITKEIYNDSAISLDCGPPSRKATTHQHGGKALWQTHNTDDISSSSSSSSILCMSWFPGRPHSHYDKVYQELCSAFLYKGSSQQQATASN